MLFRALNVHRPYGCLQVAAKVLFVLHKRTQRPGWQSWAVFHCSIQAVSENWLLLGLLHLILFPSVLDKYQSQFSHTVTHISGMLTFDFDPE